MKNKYIYPAVFMPSDEGRYGVYFPDIPGCITQGNSLAEAVAKAKDVLSIMLVAMEDDLDDIPPATMPYYTTGDTIVSFVEVDTIAYRRSINSKAVKRMVSLPGWLNERAEQEGVNVSQILQDALKERLGVSR